MGDLRIQDLVVEYSSGGYTVRPIDGLNLDVTAGSLAILLGQAAAGRRHCCRASAASSARPRARSSSATSTSRRWTTRALSTYRRGTVGIVFQAFNLVPSLTAIENVMVPMRAAGMSRRAARQRAEELLTRVGLATG